jgi:hypothetical protein
VKGELKFLEDKAKVKVWLSTSKSNSTYC